MYLTHGIRLLHHNFTIKKISQRYTPIFIKRFLRVGVNYKIYIQPYIHTTDLFLEVDVYIIFYIKEILHNKIIFLGVNVYILHGIPHGIPI